VAHGCQAGLQQQTCEKVFRDRIKRGKESYSLHRLGAFGSDLGAIACFFETPWSRVSPGLTEPAQAWLLNEAAFTLSALSRLSEALEPMRAGLEMRRNQKVWDEAARYASNLSELELTLGEVAAAARDAKLSMTYADSGRDTYLPIGHRTTHADALHQAGRRADAEACFREAEEMQQKREPKYPLLYALAGFRYCDLLLAAAERDAWQHCLSLKSQPSTLNPLESCRAVEQRANKMFEWRLPSDSLLDIALDHLTLGRAVLYAAILENSALPVPHSELDKAVDGLRLAGQSDYLPRALLTRAWLRSLLGAYTGPESARSDLDEAWEIAERGPMPLFLADIHLHRARLFGVISNQVPVISGEKYPWESPQADLAAARRLIEKHGYLRRKEELEDAEQALRG
jgi:tetratricopeptide (TPR) repeat protein